MDRVVVPTLVTSLLGAAAVAALAWCGAVALIPGPVGGAGTATSAGPLPAPGAVVLTPSSRPAADPLADPLADPMVDPTPLPQDRQYAPLHRGPVGSAG